MPYHHRTGPEISTATELLLIYCASTDASHSPTDEIIFEFFAYCQLEASTVHDIL